VSTANWRRPALARQDLEDAAQGEMLFDRLRADVTATVPQ